MRAVRWPERAAMMPARFTATVVAPEPCLGEVMQYILPFFFARVCVWVMARVFAETCRLKASSNAVWVSGRGKTSLTPTLINSMMSPGSVIEEVTSSQASGRPVWIVCTICAAAVDSPRSTRMTSGSASINCLIDQSDMFEKSNTSTTVVARPVFVIRSPSPTPRSFEAAMVPTVIFFKKSPPYSYSAQRQPRRGRNLPVFLRCSCSLDHPPEIILRLLTRASWRGRRSGLAIKLRTIKKLLRKSRLRWRRPRRRSLHQAGSHHDEQFRIRLVQCPAFEEVSKDRHVPENRDFHCDFRQPIIDQSGDGETLPVSQVHLSAHFAAGERRHCKSGDSQAVGKIQGTHFGRDFQPDDAVRHDLRQEIQPDAEFFELNGYSISHRPALQHRKWKLSAGEETG